MEISENKGISPVFARLGGRKLGSEFKKSNRGVALAGLVNPNFEMRIAGTYSYFEETIKPNNSLIVVRFSFRKIDVRRLLCGISTPKVLGICFQNWT